MTAQAVLFFIVAIIALVSAVLVITSENPVHSALWLILNLVSIAVLYYTLNAPFLMAVQLIVYAGAIVVLFVFVLMVLSTKGDAAGRHPALAWLKPASLAAAVVFLAGTVFALKNAPPAGPSPAGFVVGDPESIGRLLYRSYLLPFEATSILLLTALVGAMYLGRRGSDADTEETGLSTREGSR